MNAESGSLMTIFHIKTGFTHKYLVTDNISATYDDYRIIIVTGDWCNNNTIPKLNTETIQSVPALKIVLMSNFVLFCPDMYWSISNTYILIQTNMDFKSIM